MNLPIQTIAMVLGVALCNVASAGFTFFDDFEDSLLGPQWSLAKKEPGNSTGYFETSGQLGFWVGGTPYEIAIRCNYAMESVSSCQVDYWWWDMTNGVNSAAHFGLGVFNWDKSSGFGIKSVRNGISGYSTGAVDTIGTTPYAILTKTYIYGSFLIERNGSNFRMRHRRSPESTSPWLPLWEGTIELGSAGVPIYPYLFAFSSDTYPAAIASFNNFTFEGASSVPEPSSFVLCGAVALAVGTLRRRWRGATRRS